MGTAPERRSHGSAPAVKINGVDLFLREVGAGPAVVVLHGGPDFDHTYFLPELDRLADVCRFVYYDQRGRGRSAAGVSPEDVTLESELDDLDGVRRHLGADAVALLGHSWGGLLAMAYAGRHPERVSHLILMSTAPGSHEGRLELSRFWRARRSVEDVEAMAALAASEAFRHGDVAAEAEYYRLHFKSALRRPEHVDEVVRRLRVHFTPVTILLARAIENRLYEDTWLRADFDLLEQLERLDAPALVLHGEDDFVPVRIAERVAAAIPNARLHVLRRCGHFPFLESPEEVHRRIAELFA